MRRNRCRARAPCRSRQTNDPLVTCNPEGFPRSALFETRGFAFEHVPRRTLQLLQYQRIWREIWTDGRPLPTNVGASSKDARDPRYYGYSVGKWADDYTFVVTTTGFNEDAWADERGDPRSMDAKVEERYRRIDHDHLEVSVTIDDPKIYTKPYFVMKQVYTWAPSSGIRRTALHPVGGIGVSRDLPARGNRELTAVVRRAGRSRQDLVSRWSRYFGRPVNP